MELIMGREIRRVPKNWEHPRTFDTVNPQYKPLSEDYVGSLKYYQKDADSEPADKPNIKDYMPAGKWYQLFETVSEGTPLSPPFATKEELVQWLTSNSDYWKHQWTQEQAEGIVKSEWAPSGIMTDGKFHTSPEAAEDLNKEPK